MNIYDFMNNTRHIDLPLKKIEHIYVMVLSGDEVVNIVFEDGTSELYDASRDRFHDFFDGDYIVEGDEIKEWINFIPSGGRYAHQRMEKFKDT